MGLALLFASTAGAVVQGGGAGGVRIGVQPAAGAGAGAGNFGDPLDGTSAGVTWHGGPVAHAVTTHAVFWDPAGVFQTSTEQLIEGYLAGSAHDSGGTANVFAVGAQYTDATGPAGYSQLYGGSFVDRNPYPSGGCTTTAASATLCLDQSQELSELETFVAANHLPVGMGDLYIVLTPDTVATCVDGSNECSTDSYCSLHSYASDGSATLLYITIPFTLLDTAADAKSCQDDGNATTQAPNADPGFGDVAIRGLAHEELEAITDPLLNAWFDADGNEVADLCNGVAWSSDAFLPVEGGSASAGTLYDQTIDGVHYYAQSAWSNDANACQLMSSLEPSIGGVPGSLERGVPVALTATPGTGAAIQSYAWTFGDGQTANGPSASHSYARAGQYTVTLTVTDAFGNSGSTDESIAVTNPPGTTAAASGSSGQATSPPQRVMHCGAVRRGKHGRERRRCTTTTTSTVAASARKSASRRTCEYARARGAETWSRLRCGARVAVA